MNHETLHTIGIYIFAIALILMVIVTATCESNLPFTVTLLLSIADAVMFAVGYILIALFREVEDKWKRR